MFIPDSGILPDEFAGSSSRRRRLDLPNTISETGIFRDLRLERDNFVVFSAAPYRFPASTEQKDERKSLTVA